MKSYLCLSTRLLAVAGLFAIAPVTAAEVDSNLTGQIQQSNGAPIEGATVFVLSAAPKTGTSPFCPSCYPDCGKTAKSNAEGAFTVAGVSAQLRFRLLATAKGFAPTLIDKVEAGAKPVEVTLVPRDTTNIPAERAVRGRITDPNGNAVVGAVLEVSGVASEEHHRSFGNVQGADRMAVTDENGEFLLTSPSAIYSMFIRLSARSFANQTLELTTGTPHPLTMSEGATLTGRLVSGGQPIANAGVGLRSLDLSADTSLGHFEVGTDENGRFTFTNLPASTDYRLCSLTETMGTKGTIAARSVHVGRNGTTTNLGDIPAEPGFRISGRVVLDPPGEIPADAKISVTRRDAWDHLTVPVSPSGEFEIDHVPAEIVMLSTRVPWYQISAKNKSYDWLNRRLVGKIEGNVDDLEVLLEKMETSLPIKLSVQERSRISEEHRPENNPLHGVEILSPADPIH
jgi:hypothetical protein